MTAVRATLAQEVADALRRSIREGQIACGERMVELAIAQSMNVSQNTVRDALRQLETEGWVRYEARHGVRVRTFSAAEAEEVYALMAALEQMALGWAYAEHSRVDLLVALRPPLEQAREYHALEMLDSRRAALFGFHQTLAALSGRAMAGEMLVRLHNQAYLMATDFETRSDPRAFLAQQMDRYEHLLGVLKFGEAIEAAAALHARILADGKPVVRWLALVG